MEKDSQSKPVIILSILLNPLQNYDYSFKLPNIIQRNMVLSNRQIALLSTHRYLAPFSE